MSEAADFWNLVAENGEDMSLKPGDVIREIEKDGIIYQEVVVFVHKISGDKDE